MPAPNLETLFDVETEIETVWKNHLVSTLSLPAETSDTDTSQVTPRIECLATVQELGPHKYIVPSGSLAGNHYYDRFRVTTEMRLVYSPHWAQGQGALRGKLRKGIADYTGINTGFAINNYLCLVDISIRQINGARLIDNAQKEETLVMTIEGMYFILPSAWPT